MQETEQVSAPSPARPGAGGRRIMAVLGAALGAALLLAAAPAGAQTVAQNQLVSTEPADGATVDTSPDAIVFTFSGELGLDDALTAPVSCGNQPQRMGIPQVAEGRLSVSVPVLEPFPRGVCTVAWALRDRLGQQIAGGLLTFSVASAPDSTTTTVPGTATTTPTPEEEEQAEEPGSLGGALWFGRVLSGLGVLALAGAFALITVAWPEGVEYVNTARYLRGVWAVAAGGALLHVVATAGTVGGIGFGAALSPMAWLDLLEAAWPDRLVLLRLALVIGTGWVVLRPERLIDPTTQVVALALPAAATALVGLGRIDLGQAVVGALLGIGHAAGTAIWFGGALLVARVVVAAPGDPDLVAAVRGFHRISLIGIALTLVTGVGQMIRLDGGNLFGSGHGRVVLLKTVVVAVMLFVAVGARQFVAARLRTRGPLTPRVAARLRRGFGAEAAIGVVVLALSGWLTALSPPAEARVVVYRLERSFVDEASGLELKVLLSPGTVGLNGLRVEVTAPPDGVSDLRITFWPPADSGLQGIEQPIPLTGPGAAVLLPADGLPFSVAGEWTMEVRGITRQGVADALTTTFSVVEPVDASGP